MTHNVLLCGVSFTHQGHSLVYSGDTGVNMNCDLGKDVDLLLLECSNLSGQVTELT